MTDTIGVVLAGGRARRMGADKAFVAFRGLPMIDHVIGALRGAGLPVLVVGRDGADTTVDTIPDLQGLGGGPAVGLLSAFEHTPDRDVVLVAVDQPLLRSETIQHLLRLPGDAVVPMAAGHPQVTCALYRRSCHQALARLLASGQPKLRRLLEAVETTEVTRDMWTNWGEDGRSWRSLDTPQAVTDAEALP